jgi:hypothetical protein
MKAYLRNLGLFLAGFRWCFSREYATQRLADQHAGIAYRKGWGPWQFVLLVYWWDYGLAVLLGRGVQSLSRAFELLGEDHWLRTGPILWGSVDLWQ